MADSSPLATYLAESATAGRAPDAGFVAYLASLEQISRVAPEVSRSVVAELADQSTSLKMIASENFSSLAVQLAQGNLFTDKYAEGVPDHRFYAGCDNVDAVESLAARLACDLFGADHAYMQPHSGADANLVAYWAILEKRVQAPFMDEMGQTDPSKLNDTQWAELRTALGNQRLLGMNYYSGGHLTHGYRHNLSAKMFESAAYDVDAETGLIDYDAVRAQAQAFQPLVLLAGYSAYPRHIDFRAFREIADEVGAVLMVDMAHFAGLVAGKAFTGVNDPVAYADVVTTTTHKTLRGPRGGMVLCTQEFAEHVDRGCPMVLGGPLPHVIAAKAVALQEASGDDFRGYARSIVDNSEALAQACVDEGMTVATGGTDNHLMLLDVTPFGLTGRQAESALRAANVTLNRNSLPFDANGPWYTSGLRMGTPALTTRGMGKAEMIEIASIVKLVLSNTAPTTITRGKSAGSPSKARYRTDADALERARGRVGDLLGRFPLYPELELEYLQQHFG
jgi:glycine hydroxymethyltransferase